MLHSPLLCCILCCALKAGSACMHAYSWALGTHVLTHTHTRSGILTHIDQLSYQCCGCTHHISTILRTRHVCTLRRYIYSYSLSLPLLSPSFSPSLSLSLAVPFSTNLLLFLRCLTIGPLISLLVLSTLHSYVTHCLCYSHPFYSPRPVLSV